MSSEKKWCVNCKYEDASKRIWQMWKAEDLGIDPSELPAVWCNYHNKYIDAAKHQALRKLPNGKYEPDEWCDAFEHY